MSQPDLEKAFAELRRDDASKAPPFAPMWRPRQKRVSLLWIAAPAASFVAVAAAFAIWIGTNAARKSDAAPPAAAVASGPSVRVAMEPDPLGFLLEQPSIASLPDFDVDPTRRP
ncbi:MAG TPA: hypothetical protein VGH28_16820 [Polyangiaceae bacterium]